MGFNPGGDGGISSASDVALSNPSDAQLLGYNATVAKWENVDPEVTTADLDDKVDKGSLVLDVRDYGAKGDGVTNDATAINAAINAAAAGTAGAAVTVLLPYTSSGYMAGSIVLKSGVTLRGEDRVKLTATGSNVIWINATGQTRVGLENLTIDAAGNPTSAVVRVSAGTDQFTIKNNTFTTSTALATGVDAILAQGGTTNTLIENNDFVGMIENNVHVYADAQAVTIRNNRFTGWGDRAIYVVGSASLASTDLRIEGNRISDVSTTAGDPRQPIAIQGATGARHARVKILDNTVIGNGLPHHQGNDGGTLLGGTADQISLQHCEDFLVEGNHSINGGEVGITVSVDCHRGTVTGNVCVGNNTCAVALGGATSDVYDVVVSGNSFANNGKEQSPPATGDRAGVHAAVWCSSAHGVVIDGNSVSDDQTTPTQLWVTYLIGSDNVTIGTNATRNLSGIVDVASTVPAGTRFVGSVSAVKLAATTRSNTATLTADPDLSVAVEGAATYLLEAYLPTNATTTADVTLQWAFPTLTTITWTTDGPNVNGSSSNTAVNRLEYNQNSTAIIGGVGGNVVSKLAGTVTTTTSGGSLTLLWAQNTAEASNTTINAGAWLRLTRLR